MQDGDYKRSWSHTRYGNNQEEDSPINMVMGVPTRLNEALLHGEIDLSCVSSHAYINHCHELLLIPRLSISAPGAVKSVLLFSRYADWYDLDGKKVAVTGHSASAVELLRVLSKYRYHIDLHFVTMPPNVEAMLTTCAAALVIGDIALTEEIHHREMTGVGIPTIFDLGQEWAEWTGLPFVFGVWAARADRIDAIRSSGIVEQLYRSKVEGLAHLNDIGVEQAPRLGLTPAVCSDYLLQITFDLSIPDLEGWRLFLKLSLPNFRWSDTQWLEM